MAGNAKHTVRAGRLRLVRFAGARVFTYASPNARKGQLVRRAGVTDARKER